MTDDLLTALRDADVRPPRVDLQRAIRTGRRQRRTRHAAMAGLAVAVALAATVVIGTFAGRPQSMPANRPPLPTSTVAPPLGECTLSVDDLPYADARPWVVLDDTWRIAVHMAGTRDLIRYTDGRMERLRNAPEDFKVVGSANRAGDFTTTDYREVRGWVYRHGSFAELALPSGATKVELIDINDAGDVLGTVTPADATRREAVVWTHGRPDRPRVLDTPAGLSSRAYGIAWDGTVVGEVFDGASLTSFLWHPDGTGEPLPRPAEISQDGGVTGLVGDWAVGPDVRWNIRTGQADVIKGLDGAGIPDLYGRIFGNTDTDEHRQVVWINGTFQPMTETFNGERVQLRSVRQDGRQLSGQTTSGGWVRWDC
jgi:hypothetical protein